MQMGKITICFLISLLVGCSYQPQSLTDPAAIRLALRDRGIDPDKVVFPLSVNDEMREWAREMTAPARTDEERLQELQVGLLDPEQIRVEYQWGYTGTATEVFEHRRANCLAFTNLFVGLARDLGLPVYFLGVNDVESYRKEGDLVVISDHIAVGYGQNLERKIFDFSENPPDDYRHFERLSDLTAIAMFHSNRGAEALQLGMTDESILWLRLAVRIDPELSNAWVNLGVTYRRKGDHAAAEEAYRKALDIDPRTYSAYQNLSSLLRLLGRVKEAQAYEELLASSPNRNPFSYLTLGDISLLGGRRAEAEGLYRRATRLGTKAAEAYAALGQLALGRGDQRQARKLLKKAQKAEGEGDHPRLRQLEKTLGSG